MQKEKQVQWLFVDHRLPAETSKDGRLLSEHRKCPNGHSMFISGYRNFKEGEAEHIKCEECGVVAFEFVPFEVTYKPLKYTLKSDNQKEKTDE